jgi:hypothetical protein
MTPEEMAPRMPLTHFPASYVLDAWRTWGELRPAATLSGATEPIDAFKRIEDEHVFLYAGPACFALKRDASGDSVLYFGRGLDAELSGHAAPFDTGSCKPGGRLQPYAGCDAAECHRVIDAHSVPTDEWRACMGAWLAHCYDEGKCARYLETSAIDEYFDGEPVRTTPPEILENNGSLGRDRHPECADRRAWTWEVRTRKPVSFRWIAAIHVMPASFQTALEVSEELAKEHGVPPPEVFRTLSEVTSPRVLYEDSERILSIMLKVGA